MIESIGILLAVLVTQSPAPPARRQHHLGLAAVHHLPHAVTHVDAERRELIIELPPLDVPAATGADEGMVRAPLFQVQMPVSIWVTRYHVEMHDAEGRRLPADRLHHFNLTDPDRRELFAPIPLRILSASKETPAPSVPWLFFGMPLERGQRLLATAMVANPEPQRLRGVRVRLVFRYTPAGRPWPFFGVYPWAMDVVFPLGGEGGSKAFELPPGRSSRSWESGPAIPGTILGLGGHVHDYATSLELTDVTTGAVLWRGVPVRDSTGRVLSLPLHRFYRWYRLGARVTPEHRYRVTVTYENPTADTIHDGGMGVVAGLFVPDRGAVWPGVDTASAVYRRDLHNILANMGGNEMRGHGHRR